MKRALLWVCAIVVLLFGILLPLGASICRYVYFGPQIEASTAELISFLPKIEADLKELRANPIFENATRLRNAAPFVVSNLPLLGDNVVPTQTSSLQELFSKKFPNWSSDEKQLAELMIHPDFVNVDVAWIGRLLEFDHLDVTTEEPIAAKFKLIPRLGSIERIYTLTYIPELDTTALMLIATVHVLRAQTDVARREALTHFRKVRSLLQSDGTLVGQMAATAMLGRERKLVEILKIQNWKTVSDAEYQRYRRVAWVWPALILLTSSREFPKELEPYLEGRFGACAGAVDSTINGFTALFDFFEPQWPFETSFQTELKRSRDFKERVLIKCGQTAWLPLLRAPEPGVERVAVPKAAEIGDQRLHQIPYVRRVLGMLVEAIGGPDRLQPYKAQ